MKSFLSHWACYAADSLLFNETKRRQSHLGPWRTEVGCDRESRARKHTHWPCRVRTAAGVLCSDPFFACRVKGYKPLRALFEMEQRGLAAGLIDRMAITKREAASVNNSGHPGYLNSLSSEWMKVVRFDHNTWHIVIILYFLFIFLVLFFFGFICVFCLSTQRKQTQGELIYSLFVLPIWFKVYNLIESLTSLSAITYRSLYYDFLMFINKH